MTEIWHNPRCSKSRATLAILEARGEDVTIRRYLEDAPSEAELRAVLGMLNLAPIDLLRRGEKQAKALGLGPDSTDAALIAAMAAHPILIERPIVMKGSKACIGRPPENVAGIL